MQRKKMIMFYISASVAIIGALGYQYFVKRVPASINPIVSVVGMYAVTHSADHNWRPLGQQNR